MTQKKNSLGRGLSALLGDPDTDIMTKDFGLSSYGQQSSKVSINQIEPNPFQPRKNFEEEALQELSKSIAAQGIIQAITVRKLNTDKYQIVSGERRFRAAQLAGLLEVPVTVIIASDKDMLEKALVENIQREDLNPMEIAESYQRLITECKYTHEELSDKVGKTRTVITNFLRLLRLPEEIQQGIIESKISMGHARALLGLNDTDSQIRLYHEIITENMNVRNVEDTVRNIASQRQNKENPKGVKDKRVGENLLTRHGRKVIIKRNDEGNGSILVPFNSDDDMNDIIRLLNS